MHTKRINALHVNTRLLWYVPIQIQNDETYKLVAYVQISIRVKRQVPKALGAASCSTDITCGEGDLWVLRMAVSSSVLPETPGASPVNVKRVSAIFTL